jgi:hypothetical protein
MEPREVCGNIVGLSVKYNTYFMYNNRYLFKDTGNYRFKARETQKRYVNKNYFNKNELWGGGGNGGDK